MTRRVATQAAARDRGEADRWREANQRVLHASVGLIKQIVRRHVLSTDHPALAGESAQAADRDVQAAEETLREATASLPAPSALDHLGQVFKLSPFERDVLVLCAGVALDDSLADLCAAAQGGQQCRHATFGLCLAAFPDAHWSALTPGRPLRQWRLVKLGETATGGPATAPLRIEERVLHFLAGAPPYLDESLAGWVEPVAPPSSLVPSHRAIARDVCAVLATVSSRGPATPVVQLLGSDAGARRDIAAAACATLGMRLHAVDIGQIPADGQKRISLLRRWEREAVLGECALLIEAGVGRDGPGNPDALDHGSDGLTAARSSAAISFIDRVQAPVIIASSRPYSTSRASVQVQVSGPGPDEQRSLWRDALGRSFDAVRESVDQLIGQFDLELWDLRAACREVSRLVEDRAAAGPAELQRALWDSCREQVRPALDDVAHRIEPAASWDDLVLPARQTELLRSITVHLLRRSQVIEEWGFGARRSRGLGVTALFAGPSGTGKTLAAEVIAAELRLDLYHIDLSAVVSKYIGETEKNLRRVFDRAEQGGAILLFDEADALFGKRSEVKDSRDRYANMEVSYLLQRMEAYRGLAILTSNLQDNIDPGFLRRLRFVVDFPFPDAALRAEIWRRAFPGPTPLGDLDMARLAQLAVPGGNIASIAMSAAFLAADDGAAVEMRHVRRAAEHEYRKLGRTVTEAEVKGWA